MMYGPPPEPTADPVPLPVQAATLAVRIVTYMAALGMFGAFFLPWIHLDGHDSSHTGAELLTVFLSPEFTYLNSVSQLQSLFLMASPAVIFVSIIVLVVKKHQREISPVAGLIIIVSASAFNFVPTVLVNPNAASLGTGIVATVAIAMILLVQDLLTVIRERLKMNDKAPGAHHVLGIISASGEYRWSW